MCTFLNQFARDFSPHDVMLCITGGEPLLRLNLFDVMAHAAKLGFLWGMTTNGVLLTNEHIQKMIDTNCKTLSVSLDGLERSHNALRGYDCFDKVLEGINRLVSARSFSKVQVTTVIHKQNIHELPDMYFLLKSLGVDSWRLTNIEPIGRANQMERDFLTTNDFIKLFDFIRSCRQNRNKLPVLFGCSHYVTPEYEMDIRDHYFICGAGIFVASILHNGDIYACLDIERRSELIQGNIKKDKFKEIWQKCFSQFRQRRDQKNPDCAICIDSSFCRGDSAHTWDYDNNAPKCCLKQLLSTTAQ
jgi:radical SAM protein with 4Fe4S-binding SPASM domain